MARSAHVAVLEAAGKRHEWAHVLRLRDGMIVDMQDYASRAKAVRGLRGWRLKPWVGLGLGILAAWTSRG